MNGQFKAYPFSELAKQGGVVSDPVGGGKLQVYFDQTNQNARVLSHEGEALSAVVAFWFAWYAFHPETEVFRGSSR
jgi:hypothetical protein